MTRIGLICFLLFIAGVGRAQSQTTSAQKTFDQFLACGELKEDSALNSCLKKVTAKDLSESTRLMLFDYLHKGYRFSKLRKCRDTDKIQVFEEKKHHVYFCLDVLGDKSKLQGYAEFKGEGKALSLSAIRYGQ